MDTGTIVVFGVFFFTAVGMYIVLEFRRYGKGREVVDKVLRLQADLATAKKALVGYTKYPDYLAAAKQAAAEQMKGLAVKVTRESIHLESPQEEPPGPKAEVKSEATVIVKYAVDYTFGFDAKPDSFELVGTPAGIELKIGKPKLMVTSAVRPLSHGAASKAELTEEHMAVIRKLPAVSHKQGTAIALDDATQALCEKKLLEFLHNFLAKQQGVKQVPFIQVSYL
jgi:hypothetical protein